MDKKKYAKSLAAFTLSELLLAAAILVFVLAGLLALFLNCLILNEANRNLTVATSHAQYIMEEIKDAANTDFTQLESRINNGDWDLNASQIQAAPYNLTALSNESINTNVTRKDENNPNLLIISVIVQWNDRGQRPRSAQLDTLIANYK
jgi:type II secretory pathway pseudopilin PulG